MRGDGKLTWTSSIKKWTLIADSKWMEEQESFLLSVGGEAVFLRLLRLLDGVGAIWQLVEGVDDGADGIPNGTDTFTIDRNTGAFPANNMDLSDEGLPIHSIARITAPGAPGRDIILKHTADPVTIGDLTVRASASVFHTEEERAANLIIDGVISGPGDLLLSRAGGFSTPEADDFITITGSSRNTITGSVRLWNSSPVQISNWVADKVGAFGPAPTLMLEGNPGATGVTTLIITSNTMSGEGAIDDDAISVFIGAQGLLTIEAGVNENIREGKLSLDLSGSGTYTEVPQVSTQTLKLGSRAMGPYRSA